MFLKEIPWKSEYCSKKCPRNPERKATKWTHFLCNFFGKADIGFVSAIRYPSSRFRRLTYIGYIIKASYKCYSCGYSWEERFTTQGLSDWFNN